MTGAVETPAPERSLSVRVVDRAAALVSRGVSRRGFLYRVAVVASALAVNPLRYVLRPTPAYASVCGSGNSCSSGWSVFCCTINGGANTCPSGSYVAGWWKVDSSAFCLGSPRYYVDCNRLPGSSCRRRCNSKGCDNRRVCWNVFRYGQCNTQIAGVTEVVCRLITCTPPWKWDPSCGRTVRTEEATRSHSSKCLPGENPSHIEIKYQDMGLVGSILGEPEGRERDGARGGRKRRYERGMILWHESEGAHEVHGKVATRYRKWGADAGKLGYPRTDHKAVGDDKGDYVRFERGSIYRHPAIGARAVGLRHDRRFRHLGGPTGRLGYPRVSTKKAGGGGTVTRFERGDVYASPDTRPREVRGRFAELFRRLGGPDGSGLGYPVTIEHERPDGGRIQRFEDGAILGPTRRKAKAVWGATWRRYDREGVRAWGYPTTHTQRLPSGGTRANFERGSAYWSKATGVHWLDGPIRDRYWKEGGPEGHLGYPKTDRRRHDDGLDRAGFEHGRIVYDPKTGEVKVFTDDE